MKTALVVDLFSLADSGAVGLFDLLPLLIFFDTLEVGLTGNKPFHAGTRQLLKLCLTGLDNGERFIVNLTALFKFSKSRAHLGTIEANLRAFFLPVADHTLYAGQVLEIFELLLRNR